MPFRTCSRVSEALGRRVRLAERRRIVCLSGQESARPIPARRVHSSRVAIKPAAVVKAYALRSQARRFDESQHVATGVVVRGGLAWSYPLAANVAAGLGVFIYGFDRGDSDHQGRPFGYKRRRRSRSPATPQRRGSRYGLCRSCTAQHDLGHSSTCRPLSPLGLASDPGLDELECGSRLDSEAAPAAIPLRPRSTCLSGRSSSPWRFAAPYRRAHSPRRTTGPRRPLRIAQTDTRSHGPR
jgi:hypothetical protein